MTRARDGGTIRIDGYDVTLSDIVTGLQRRHLIDERTVRQVALLARHERRLEEVSREIDGLLAADREAPAAPNARTPAWWAAWSKRQDRITELFDEHGRLLELAYPRAMASREGR